MSVDATGYNFGPDMLSATEDGKWVSYVYQNPESDGIGANHTGALEYTPRLNVKKFEKIIVDELRANILTESNIRDLVKLLDEEMDGVALDQRERLESIDGELEDVKKRLGRVWHFIARSDSVDVASFGPHRGTPGAQGDP